MGLRPTIGEKRKGERYVSEQRRASSSTRVILGPHDASPLLFERTLVAQTTPAIHHENLRNGEDGFWLKLRRGKGRAEGQVRLSTDPSSTPSLFLFFFFRLTDEAPVGTYPRLLNIG